MCSQHAEPSFSPFVLLTERLILIPTPIAVNFPSYRKLYASLHANPAFCEMAFGQHFPAVTWTDDETREVIRTRDIGRCWNKRGMGDFAVALRASSDVDEGLKRSGVNQTQLCSGLVLVAAKDSGSFITWLKDSLDWAGYTGVRDATTTSLPDLVKGSSYPAWQEMVEVRYGVAQAHWGKGVARDAAEVVMQWAMVERGVRRFIAETEKTNVRSGRVLEKMGFKRSGTNYWQEPSEVEWERTVS